MSKMTVWIVDSFDASFLVDLSFLSRTAQGRIEVVKINDYIKEISDVLETESRCGNRVEVRIACKSDDRLTNYIFGGIRDRIEQELKIPVFFGVGQSPDLSHDDMILSGIESGSEFWWFKTKIDWE